MHKVNLDSTLDKLINNEDKKNNKIKILAYEFDDNLLKKEALILTECLLYKPGEFKYELSNTNRDIGQILRSLNLQPYQKIQITLKRGVYIWNEYYNMPEKSSIRFIWR